MNKERLIAFTDAVLAIIMTILVLELEKPSELSFEGFWELRYNFLAYALSFFWIGAVWVALNNIWEDVKRISRPVMWWTLVFLFCLSFMPYATGIVSTHYDSAAAQAFYGIIVTVATSCNWILHKQIDVPNSDSLELLKATKAYRAILVLDIAIKVAFLIITLTVYPTAMLMGVLISVVVLQVSKAVVLRKAAREG